MEFSKGDQGSRALLEDSELVHGGPATSIASDKKLARAHRRKPRQRSYNKYFLN